MKLELEKINLTPKTLEEATETIGHLVKIILELKQDNDSLREQLNNNSKNSSIPPSRDIKKKKSTKASTGRKRGGQHGHTAWQRSIVPSEEVDTVVDCKPAERCECGGVIKLKDKVQIHQVFEIPTAQYEVTEYRLYKGCCDTCHLKHGGQLPAGVNNKGFGVRTQAMISLLTSKYRLSKRLVQSWFQDVYQMPICLGSVSNVEHTVSKSLKSIHEETFAAVQKEKVVYVDETGKQKKRLRQLKNNMLKWLVAGTYCGHNKTARTCENILSLQHSLWHFFDNPAISPTNNHAERQLRALVISKKLTFGTQSERGSRYIERIFTVVTSCKQQARDALAFLADAVQRYFLGQAAPSLLAAS